MLPRQMRRGVVFLERGTLRVISMTITTMEHDTAIDLTAAITGITERDRTTDMGMQVTMVAGQLILHMPIPRQFST
jgi:hypothetical protein